MRITVIGKCPPLEGGVSRRTFDCVRAFAKGGQTVSYFTNADSAIATCRAAYDEEDHRYADGALRGVRHASLRHGERLAHIPSSPAFETRLIGMAAEAVEQSDYVIGWYYQPYGVAAAILAQRFDKPCFLVHAGSDLGRLARVKDLQVAYRCLFAKARFFAMGPTMGTMISEGLALGTKEQVIVVSTDAVALPSVFADSKPLDVGHLSDYTRPHLAQWEIPAQQKEFLLELDRKEFDPDVPTIGTYGKLGEQKGNHDLLQALEALARAGRKFNFLLCGGGRPPAIGAFLDRLRESKALRDRTWLFPFITPWKVPQFIARCDLVAFLERDFPIVFHAPRVPREIMAVGTTLLCSREIVGKQDFQDWLVDRTNYVDAGDPRDIARLTEAIDYCLADRSRLRQIGAAGRKLLVQYEASASPEDPIIAALRSQGLL